MRSLFPPARRHTAFVLALLWAAACGPGTDSIPVVDELVVQDPAMVLLDSVPKIMQRADVPGLQLAYLEAGQVIMTAAFGYANSETETPVTDGTVFEAASLSKPVFAYAVPALGGPR